MPNPLSAFLLTLTTLLAATQASAQSAGTETAPAGDEAATTAALDPVGDPVGAWNQDPSIILDAAEVDINAFVWRARPIVVFADSPLDPAFNTQIDLLLAGLDDLIERDIVMITDTNPTAMSDLRTQLRPRGFMMVLIGKDGGVKQRKPFPWSMREIGRTIDKMPMRQREIIERRATNG